MANVEYTAELDDSQVLKALKNIDRNLDKLANEGEKSFNKVGKSAKQAGVQIGTTAGIVTALTQRFIHMGEQAARALLEIAKGGIELNERLETLEIQLTNILSGNQKAAQAFLGTVEDVATRLRVDYLELAELATRVLPEAKDLERSAELAGLTLQLAAARAVPEANASRALSEALSGQFVSMQKILNVSTQQIQKIKDLEGEIGRTAAIAQVLGEELENAGFNVDDMAKAFTGVFKLIDIQGRRIQRIFTIPVFEELRKQAAAFLAVFEEHEDDIERVAVAFGQFVADVVKLLGTNLVDFIDSIDYDLLEDTADAFSDMLAAADALIRILTDGDINSALVAIKNTAQDIAEAMYTAVLAASLLKAEIAKRQAEAVALQEQGRGLRVGPVVIGRAEDPQVAAAGQEAYNQVMEEQVAIIEELNQRLQENKERTKERQEATEEDTQATLAAAQADLDREAALEELAEAQSDAAEAQERINEEMEEQAQESQRRITRIMLDQERQRLEDAIDAANKRVDLARENAQEIEDIFRQHEQSIADAALDLSRDEEDIARRAARDRAEVERDAARERVDIETEFRRELERIRVRFEESAAEAERRNDAQAFLEAVRQRDREVSEAERGRDEQLEDARGRAERQREDLNRQLQHEIEDAKIANRRKLEDLQIRLERELEAQRINYERELEEQALSEQRKKEERDRANAQELEDFAIKEAQRLEDLNKSLEDEFEMVQHYEELKRRVRVAEAERTVEEVNAAYANLQSFGGVGAGTPVFLQEGGPVQAGRPYLVGEQGPELFVPGRSGVVVPTPQIVALPSPAAAQSINTSNTNLAPTFNVSESIFGDPVAVRRMQNLVLEVLAGAL